MNENHCEIIYSYSKNYLLFLLNNKIYQIEVFNYHQVTTIYQLDINFTKELNLNQPQYCFINVIHYYNKDLKKIEELFLFNIKNSNKKNVYPYFWNNHEFKSIKSFILPYFIDIIQLNFFESSQNVLKDSLITERILVNSDSLIIFK